MRYFVEARITSHVKGYGFFSFARKCRKQLLDTGPDALKTVSKKVVHDAAKATGEFIEYKITDKIVNL